MAGKKDETPDTTPDGGTPGTEPETTQEDGEKTGLETTGNPADLSTKTKTTETAPAHQDDTPEDLAKVADEAADQGFLGVPAEEKKDYSQRNPDVMNGGK